MTGAGWALIAKTRFKWLHGASVLVTLVHIGLAGDGAGALPARGLRAGRGAMETLQSPTVQGCNEPRNDRHGHAS